MKSFIYTALILVVTGFLFTGCKSKRVAATFSDLNGEWNIVEMNGRRLNPEKTYQTMSLDVERQTISGHAGCNRMSGKIEYVPGQKNVIKFPRMVTTRMACEEMSLENELLKTMDKIVRFDANTETKPINAIAFYGIDNTKLLVIERK